MNIQSISIVVPTKGCINDCKCCVSKMHCSEYADTFNKIQIEKRIKFAINNGVNTCILTGTGEALQNTKFLENLYQIFNKLNHPFPNVELQTTGVLINKKETPEAPFRPNIHLLQQLQVNTISLSVFDIFDDQNNMDLIGVSKKLHFKLKELIDSLKDRGFNIRLCLNMINKYDEIRPEELFEELRKLKVDQITFRKLWHANDKSPQSKWVIKNECTDNTLQRITNYIEGWEKPQIYGMPTEKINGHGIPLYRLPFGAIAYSVNGISTVIDNNCMNKNNLDVLKYVILRENGKLYSQWDDEGSLIF